MGVEGEGAEERCGAFGEHPQGVVLFQQGIPQFDTLAGYFCNVLAQTVGLLGNRPVVIVASGEGVDC